MMDTTQIFYQHANNLRQRFKGNAPRPISDGELALTAALLTLADAVARVRLAPTEEPGAL